MYIALSSLQNSVPVCPSVCLEIEFMYPYDEYLDKNATGLHRFYLEYKRKYFCLLYLLYPLNGYFFV